MGGVVKTLVVFDGDATLRSSVAEVIKRDYGYQADVMAFPFEGDVLADVPTQKAVVAWAQKLRSLHNWQHLHVFGRNRKQVTLVRDMLVDGLESQPESNQVTLLTPQAVPIGQRVSLFIHCSDFRFREITDKDIEEKAGGYAHVIAIPAPALHLAQENTRPIVLRFAEVYQHRYAWEDMICTGHQDCGGHGGSKNFPDYDTEMKEYQQTLEKAADALQRSFGKKGTSLAIFPLPIREAELVH